MPIYLGATERTAKPRHVPEPPLASLELQHRITQFYYREARLLDEEQYEQWLGLMTEDVHYFMPVIFSKYRDDRRPEPAIARAAHFDDDLFGMRRRVTRFVQKTAWAEDPPTRCVRVISGIEIESTGIAGQYTVHSTFTNCRSRNETDEDILYGRRRDLIKEIDGNLRLAKREIRITQAVLKSKNLNIFL